MSVVTSRIINIKDYCKYDAMRDVKRWCNYRYWPEMCWGVSEGWSTGPALKDGVREDQPEQWWCTVRKQGQEIAPSGLYSWIRRTVMSGKFSTYQTACWVSLSVEDDDWSQITVTVITRQVSTVKRFSHHVMHGSKCTHDCREMNLHTMEKVMQNFSSWWIWSLSRQQ